VSLDHPIPDWWMRGSLVGVCNCAWGCPCNFDAPPTYGFCDGFYTLAVAEGAFGHVDLSNVAFAWGGHSPGAVHEGGLEEVLVIDVDMAPEQREAIERLWRGGGVGSPFDEFASVRSVWFDPVVATFELTIDGIRSRVRVSGDAEFAVDLVRVRNPVTGEEEELYLDKPTGFTSTRSELGTTTTARFAWPGGAYDLVGRYAEYAEFSYMGPETR
jgi:hypothetical protein